MDIVTWVLFALFWPVWAFAFTGKVGSTRSVMGMAVTCVLFGALILAASFA